MAAISQSTSAVNTSTTIQETTYRRIITAELAEIQRMLDHCELRDSITEDIRKWLCNFKEARKSLDKICSDEAIREAKHQELKRTFAKLLQDLLRDPLTNSFLDEHALLGNDGRTYNSKALAIWLSKIDNPYTPCFPLNPDDDRPFIVSSHTIVPHMIQWLKKSGFPMENSKLEKEYNDLKFSSKLPIFPMLSNLRIRQTLKHNAEKGLRRIDETHYLKESKEIIEQFRAQAHLGFSEIQRKRIALGQKAKKEITSIGKNEKQLGVQFATAVKDLESLLERLNNGIEEAKEHQKDLAKKLNKVNDENIRLKQHIEETRQIIMEKQKESANSLLSAIAVVGLCVFSTWAISTFASGISVSPMPGGASINVSIPV